MSEQTLPPAEFRQGTEADWPFIERIVSHTWDGEDYITEKLWQAWVLDSDGYLAVGTIANRIVTLGRVTHFGPSEWWLEGLRVHPKGQGQGLGLLMMNHLVVWFKQHGDGILRTSTYSKNEQTQRLARDKGFKHVLSFTRMKAPSEGGQYHDFNLLEPHNQEIVHEYFNRSPMYRFNHFAEHRWQIRNMTRDRLASYLEDESIEVVGWRQGDQLAGLCILYNEPPEGREAQEDTLYVGYVDALDDTTARAMLASLKGLAAARELDSVAWKMPTGMGLEKSMDDLGFSTEWDGQLHLHERPVTV